MLIVLQDAAIRLTVQKVLDKQNRCNYHISLTGQKEVLGYLCEVMQRTSSWECDWMGCWRQFIATTKRQEGARSADIFRLISLLHSLSVYNQVVDIESRYQMPVNSSRDAKTTPPSEMIRVPNVLIPVVRQLAKIHRDGHTIALLQGLEELISQFDSSMVMEATTELQHVESKLEQIETQLSQQSEGVERKLELIAKHLEKLERAVASGRYNGGGQARNRRSAYS
ncbi:hypothetical protein H6G54_22370 [Anabaena cylindrica FACHB-243]|uniref:Uncharacterized protein n=1 Tax=Anabaena cylindrica (strain ATCC 27899 / PCC 7122) TaxID=272123 RepID=K9ZQE8_ANACC|nr:MULTISPECIES: hypothetical protein [Anabaena]AFZ61401.1 hypothetical protein Anacy_6131 [Anabaena cylindrica PCC 7122]MBD2420398.1 hypothetical protein [Anabaena cylindrica FACHB-243]MCM2405979.1 hypothetical protein [Anabaena sp. CCAP 1446/1C]BAY06702.1 hypothetical protein NIES19_59850 [Anabaena cylindrica PCC 7122]